jgi:hypothetical protein
MVHRIIMLRKTLNVVLIHTIFSLSLFFCQGSVNLHGAYKNDRKKDTQGRHYLCPHSLSFFPTSYSSDHRVGHILHRRRIVKKTLKVVVGIYVLFSPPFSSSYRFSTEYVTSCIGHRRMIVRKTLKVVLIYAHIPFLITAQSMSHPAWCTEYG